MLKTQWLALKQGDFVYNNRESFLIGSVNKSTGDITTICVSGAVAGNNNLRIGANTRSMAGFISDYDSQTPWRQMTVVPRETIIKKHTFGRIWGTGEFVISISNFDKEKDDIMEVMFPGGLKRTIPWYLFTRDHYAITAFSGAITLRVPKVNPVNLTVYAKEGEGRPPYPTYSGSTAKTFRHVVIGRQDRFFQTLAEVCEPYFNMSKRSTLLPLVSSNNVIGQSIYFDANQLSIASPKQSIMAPGKTTMYLGKDYNLLKNGDLCLITNIKPDYSSNKLNIVSIRSVKNGYETRVFEKNLKLIK